MRNNGILVVFEEYMLRQQFLQKFDHYSKDEYTILVHLSLNLNFIVIQNLIFATNSDFIIPLSLKPNVVDLRYFKL